MYKFHIFYFQRKIMFEITGKSKSTVQSKFPSITFIETKVSQILA